MALLGEIAVFLDDGHNVAVHFRQSVGRSGLIAAGLLVYSGVSANKAVEAVSVARGEAIPETTAQLEWIRQLPSAVPIS